MRAQKHRINVEITTITRDDDVSGAWSWTTTEGRWAIEWTEEEAVLVPPNDKRVKLDPMGPLYRAIESLIIGS